MNLRLGAMRLLSNTIVFDLAVCKNSELYIVGLNRKTCSNAANFTLSILNYVSAFLMCILQENIQIDDFDI